MLSYKHSPFSSLSLWVGLLLGVTKSLPDQQILSRESIKSLSQPSSEEDKLGLLQTITRDKGTQHFCLMI